jgi:hypothetical protein
VGLSGEFVCAEAMEVDSHIAKIKRFIEFSFDSEFGGYQKVESDTTQDRRVSQSEV